MIKEQMLFFIIKTSKQWFFLQHFRPINTDFCHRAYQKSKSDEYSMTLSASVVRWLEFLTIDQKVMGSNPGRSKGVFF